MVVLEWLPKKDFANDEKNMRQEVFAFLKASLDEIALQMVKTNEDTTNLSKAYAALDKAEAKLRAKYEQKPEVQNSRSAV